MASRKSRPSWVTRLKCARAGILAYFNFDAVGVSTSQYYASGVSWVK